MITSNFYRAALISFCFFISSTASWAAPVPLDKVVAIINNSVLTQNQLNETTEEIKQQLQATNQPIPDNAVLRKKALDKAIGELLQLQVAQRANIKVSDEDVTRAINQIAKQNNFSLDQLKEALQKQGITYARYRVQIHDQMVIQQVQQQALAGKVQISKADVQAYLKKAPAPNNEQARYHLDDLLIPLKESATPAEVEAANNQAKELLHQARAGTPFEELAKKSVQHIDLQWRATQDLPEVFANAVKDLKIGEIAGPIQAPNGLHILRLIDAQGHTAALTEAEAKQRVLMQKAQEQADKWVLELRKSAYVKIM